MLTGSHALAVWGHPRMTRDIDFVIEADQSGVARFLDACAADCYADPEAAADAVARGTFFNVIHKPTILKLDFIMRRDEPFEREKFGRRVSMTFGGVSVDVITAEDLILSKLQWAAPTGSARQMEDVRTLRRSAVGLDEAYLARWAPILGVAEQLRATDA